MKYFYFVVTVELDRNENIFSDEKKEPSMRLFSYVVRASGSTNLVQHFGCIQGLKSVNIFGTKKEAESLAEAWNESYKKNGTYYRQKAQNLNNKIKILSDDKMDYENLCEIFKAYEDAEEYVSANGHKCLRTIGTYWHYRFYCDKAGLSSEWFKNGLSAKADSGKGWGLDWVEEDIILWHE